MGASKSKESEQLITDIDLQIEQENLKFIKQVDDVRYGKCRIFKSDRFDYTIAVVRQILQRDSEADLRKFSESATELASLDHDSVIKLLRHTSKKENEFCSSYWKVNLFFEYVSNDLQADILRRKREEVFYDESELWHIIVSVIAALAYLRSRGFEHGDIKPSSVLLNEQGKVKLLPKPINQSTENMNSYMQALMGVKKAKYLSPILLRSLQQQNEKPQHNCTKSDIFSLGLVILEAALLQEQDDIYDFMNFEIIPRVLNQKLDMIRQKYSIQLSQFIQSMLVTDELERPDIDILFAYIEELCRQGAQMADRIFSLGINDRSPTYNENDGQGNQIYDYHDIKHDSMKKSPNSYQTPIKGQSQHAQPFISNNYASNRQEKVRRSNWVQDENTDNNIYIGSAATSSISPYIGTSSLGQKQYTFGDNYSSMSNQYATSLTSNQASTSVPSAYVPLLIKEGTYVPTTSISSTTNHYSTNPISSYKQSDLTNLDSINQIIAKYSNYQPQKV